MKNNIKIEIEQCIDLSHLRSLWYGGTVATISILDYEFVIVANGDICCYGVIKGQEIRCKDKQNGGALYDTLRNLVKNDNEIKKLIRSDNNKNYLYFEDQNWFEVFVSKKGGNEFEDSFVLDSEKISDAIIEVLENAKEYLQWLTEEETEKSFDESLLDIDFSGTTIEVPLNHNNK